MSARAPITNNKQQTTVSLTTQKGRVSQMSTYAKFHDYITKPQTVRFFKSVNVSTDDIFHNIIDFGLDYFNDDCDDDERVNNEFFTAVIFSRNGGITNDWITISEDNYVVLPELKRFKHNILGWLSTPYIPRKRG